jgi:hypothetical protein
MRVLLALLILIAIPFAIVALLPILSAGLALAVVFGGLFLWFLPILIIACSDQTTGGEKLAWILAIVFLSWFAWIFYFLLAPVKAKPRYLEYRYR